MSRTPPGNWRASPCRAQHWDGRTSDTGRLATPARRPGGPGRSNPTQAALRAAPTQTTGAGIRPELGRRGTRVGRPRVPRAERDTGRRPIQVQDTDIDGVTVGVVEQRPRFRPRQANILASALDVLAPLLAARTRSGGAIALSGILAGQQDELLQRYAEWFDDLHVEQLEDWIRIDARRR